MHFILCIVIAKDHRLQSASMLQYYINLFMYNICAKYFVVSVIDLFISVCELTLHMILTICIMLYFTSGELYRIVSRMVPWSTLKPQADEHMPSCSTKEDSSSLGIYKTNQATFANTRQNFIYNILLVRILVQTGLLVVLNQNITP